MTKKGGGGEMPNLEEALSRKPKGNNKVGANKRLGVVRPLTASPLLYPFRHGETRTRSETHVMIAGVR